MADHARPSIHSRPYRDEADFWRVRHLLIETYPITPTAFNWEVRRWDGSHFHRDPADRDAAAARVRLWEADEERLVAAVHDDGPGSAVLELHPDFRFLEEEMVAWAEEHLSVAAEGGSGRRLGVCVEDYDRLRKRLLAERGYEQQPHGGVQRHMRFGSRALPESQIAPGYLMRTIRAGDESEYGRMADLLNAGFGRTFHTAAEYRHFVEGAPSFRQDLNLVAEAPDGSFAAHVGVTYEEVNRQGIFEPVVTHPDHRRRGLARGLMYEGMRRARALGATDMYVGTGEQVPANELYDALGFTEACTEHTWRRQW